MLGHQLKLLVSDKLIARGGLGGDTPAWAIIIRLLLEVLEVSPNILTLCTEGDAEVSGMSHYVIVGGTFSGRWQ